VSDTDEEFRKALADAPPATDPQEILSLQRQNKALEEKLEKYRSGERIIRETLLHIFEHQPVLRIPREPPPEGSGTEEVAVLHVSDTQLGKKTDSYDMQVARDRLILLAHKVGRWTQMRRKNARVSDLRLYLGGDLIEGENIFPHQAHLIDVPLLDQAVRAGPRIFVEMVLALLQHFPRIRIISVPGNHGRGDIRGHPRTNWDTVCAEVVKYMLLGTPEHPREELADRVTMEVASDFHVVDRVWDWGNLVVHGHQITGTWGIPFYGAKNAVAGWADSIDEPWDYLWFGHFHTYGSLVINHRLWLANGTTESDNDYALERLKSRNVPCQRLAFFNEAHGLVSDHQIFLDARVPQAQRFRDY
jgi:hypothetical protein